MPGSPLSGRVALVTGASGGIGRAISTRLGEAGARVALHYSSARDAAEQAAAELHEAVVLQADLSDPEQCTKLVDDTEAALGPVDVLVANAGASKRQALEHVTLEDWTHLIDVNLRAPFLQAQRVVPGMQERGFGRILFVSSVAAFTGGVVGPHYAASKAGLLGLAHFIAARVAANGVTVNVLAPALIEETGMLPGSTEELAQLVPVGRLGKPGEVAHAALAMLENGYLTNQTVLLDGGMHPR